MTQYEMDADRRRQSRARFIAAEVDNLDGMRWMLLAEELEREVLRADLQHDCQLQNVCDYRGD